VVLDFGISLQVTFQFSVLLTYYQHFTIITVPGPLDFQYKSVRVDIQIFMITIYDNNDIHYHQYYRGVYFLHAAIKNYRTSLTTISKSNIIIILLCLHVSRKVTFQLATSYRKYSLDNYCKVITCNSCTAVKSDSPNTDHN
jgi:hypothetical protein